MISFEHFEPGEGLPIYLQIVQYIKRGVVGGAIPDGEELPSRRALSALLGVNPNTVQKAYRMLEEEGLIQSRAGAKSCVALDEGTIPRLRGELLREDVRPFVRTLRQSGLKKEEALGLIETVWEEET